MREFSAPLLLIWVFLTQGTEGLGRFFSGRVGGHTEYFVGFALRSKGAGKAATTPEFVAVGLGFLALEVGGY